MAASKLSKMIMWATIVWVILVSYPKKISTGPISFAGCVSQFAGPVCAGAAATATASCAASAWAPPLFCACVSGIMVATCGVSCAVCIGSLIAPTP